MVRVAREGLLPARPEHDGHSGLVTLPSLANVAIPRRRAGRRHDVQDESVRRNSGLRMLPTERGRLLLARYYRGQDMHEVMVSFTQAVTPMVDADCIGQRRLRGQDWSDTVPLARPEGGRCCRHSDQEAGS